MLSRGRAVLAGLALLGGSLAGQTITLAPASASTSHHATPAITTDYHNPCFPLDDGWCHLRAIGNSNAWGMVEPRGPMSATPDVLDCMFGFGSRQPCTSRGIDIPHEPDTEVYGWHILQWHAGGSGAYAGKTAGQFSPGAWDQRYANVLAWVKCSYNTNQHSFMTGTILAGPTIHGRRVSTNVVIPCTKLGRSQGKGYQVDVNSYLQKIIPPDTWYSRDWHATFKINFAQGGKDQVDISLWQRNLQDVPVDPDPEVVHTHH